MKRSEGDNEQPQSKKRRKRSSAREFRESDGRPSMARDAGRFNHAVDLRRRHSAVPESHGQRGMIDRSFTLGNMQHGHSTAPVLRRNPHLAPDRALSPESNRATATALPLIQPIPPTEIDRSTSGNRQHGHPTAPVSSRHPRRTLAPARTSSPESNRATAAALPLIQPIPPTEMVLSPAQRHHGQQVPLPPPAFGRGNPDEVILIMAINMHRQHLQDRQRLAEFAAFQGHGRSFAALDPRLLDVLAAQSVPPAAAAAAASAAVLPANTAAIPPSAIDPGMAARPAAPQPGMPPEGVMMLPPSRRDQQVDPLRLQRSANELLQHQHFARHFGSLPLVNIPTPFARGPLVPAPGGHFDLAARTLLPPPLPGMPEDDNLPPARTAPLYSVRDEDMLSDHQILLRQQIEFFEARSVDIRSFTPSRRKEISVNQVGIRCMHCAARLEPHTRNKGSMYFPSTLRALYQAAQNMGTTHFRDRCPLISIQARSQLCEYMETRAVVGYGGKQYWADDAKAAGVYETELGLRFREPGEEGGEEEVTPETGEGKEEEATPN